MSESGNPSCMQEEQEDNGYTELHSYHLCFAGLGEKSGSLVDKSGRIPLVVSDLETSGILLLNTLPADDSGETYLM